MAITPIGGANLINTITSKINVEQKSDEFVSFSQLLNNAVDQVEKSEQSVKAAEVQVATGEADDLHTVMIEAAKADLAVQSFVQIRNKALEAYNEIMRITL